MNARKRQNGPGRLGPAEVSTERSEQRATRKAQSAEHRALRPFGPLPAEGKRWTGSAGAGAGAGMFPGRWRVALVSQTVDWTASGGRAGRRWSVPSIGRTSGNHAPPHTAPASVLPRAPAGRTQVTSELGNNGLLWTVWMDWESDERERMGAGSSSIDLFRWTVWMDGHRPSVSLHFLSHSCIRQFVPFVPQSAVHPFIVPRIRWNWDTGTLISKSQTSCQPGHFGGLKPWTASQRNNGHDNQQLTDAAASRT